MGHTTAVAAHLALNACHTKELTTEKYSQIEKIPFLMKLFSFENEKGQSGEQKYFSKFITSYEK